MTYRRLVLLLLLCACGSVSGSPDAGRDGAFTIIDSAPPPPDSPPGTPDATPCAVPTITFYWWHRDCSGWGCAAEGGSTDFVFYLNGSIIGAKSESPSCDDQSCPGYTNSLTIPVALIQPSWRGDGTDQLRFTKDSAGNFYFMFAVADWGAAGSLRNCYTDVTASDCTYGCAYDYGYYCGTVDLSWTVVPPGAACP